MAPVTRGKLAHRCHPKSIILRKTADAYATETCTSIGCWALQKIYSATCHMQLQAQPRTVAGHLCTQGTKYKGAASPRCAAHNTRVRLYTTTAGRYRQFDCRLEFDVVRPRALTLVCADETFK